MFVLVAGAETAACIAAVHADRVRRRSADVARAVRDVLGLGSRYPQPFAGAFARVLPIGE